MKPEIEAVVKLQRLDNRLSDLQKEIEGLPKHVAAIEKNLDSHLRKLELDRSALAGNHKTRKQLEDDIKVQEQKISKLRDQMLQAKTNEQYRAFQNEIGYCETEIRKAEDRILDLMAEAEPLEQAVKKAEVALTEEKKVVEGEKDRARKQTEEDKGILQKLEEERKQLTAAIDGKVLTQYERIRRRWHGHAVSDATEGRCSACQIALRPQRWQDLKKGDQLLTCETCGRILYYNPPVDFSAELQQA
jgi:predicted  nucleic acid-binding Zn-ribbon protein